MHAVKKFSVGQIKYHKITKVVRVQPPETINNCSKFHDNSDDISQAVSLWSKLLDPQTKQHYGSMAKRQNQHNQNKLSKMRLKTSKTVFVSVFRCGVWCSVHSQPHGGGAEAGGGDSSSSSDRSLPRHPGTAALVRWTADTQRSSECLLSIERGSKSY